MSQAGTPIRPNEAMYAGLEMSVGTFLRGFGCGIERT